MSTYVNKQTEDNFSLSHSVSKNKGIHQIQKDGTYSVQEIRGIPQHGLGINQSDITKLSNIDSLSQKNHKAMLKTAGNNFFYQEQTRNNEDEI